MFGGEGIEGGFVPYDPLFKILRFCDKVTYLLLFIDSNIKSPLMQA